MREVVDLDRSRRNRRPDLVIHWLSQLESIEMCANMHVAESIHGHEGRTKVQWVD